MFISQTGKVLAKFCYRKFKNALHKMFYMPLCRAYARYILGDNQADAVMCLLSALDFWMVHGYWPHLNKPRSFSEKIYNRMLFDRNHQWVLLTDKFGMRDYVSEKVGKNYSVPLLWKGFKPEEIPFEKLPSKFVIKATHGCKYNIIVKDKTKLDKSKTIRQLKQWLGENFCQDKFIGIEWAYKKIKPAIIVEAFLDDKGKVPLDYKFFCYSGRVEFVQVSIDRFGDASEQLLDSELNLLNLYNGVQIYQGKVVRPENYESMVQVAEALARDFNFIRIDVYNINGKIYVGELTCYPAGARAIFIPRKYDFIFGEKWEME